MPQPTTDRPSVAVWWERAGDWVEVDVVGCWPDTGGGPGATVRVRDCSRGLSGRIWPSEPASEIRPGDRVALMLWWAALPADEFRPGRELRVQYLGWRTSANGHRYRKFHVEDLCDIREYAPAPPDDPDVLGWWDR